MLRLTKIGVITRWCVLLHSNSRLYNTGLFCDMFSFLICTRLVRVCSHHFSARGNVIHAFYRHLCPRGIVHSFSTELSWVVLSIFVLTCLDLVGSQRCEASAFRYISFQVVAMLVMNLRKHQY